MSGPMQFPPESEERVAARMAGELEALATSSVVPSADFAEHVMAAVADEPLPQPARAFRRALGAGRIGTATAAVRDAARLVTVPRIPLSVRAQSVALVLVVALGSLGIVGGAAVGASALLRGTPAPVPSPSVPPSRVSPSPSPSPSPSTSTSPSTSPDAIDTADPTETPEATDTAEPTDESTAEPTGTDDHHDGSGSGSGSDHGGESGSGSGTSGSGSDGSGGAETPEPTGTGEHGGSSDG